MLTNKEYKSVERQFRGQCCREGLDFDIDVYCNTILKVCEKFGNEIADNLNGIKNYLWCAFKTNLLREELYAKASLVDDITEYDSADEQYDNSIDNLYNDIISDIINKFGEQWANMFKLHIENGETYKNLSFQYNIPSEEIHNKIRNIREYIKNKHRKN